MGVLVQLRDFECGNRYALQSQIGNDAVRRGLDVPLCAHVLQADDQPLIGRLPGNILVGLLVDISIDKVILRSRGLGRVETDAGDRDLDDVLSGPTRARDPGARSEMSCPSRSINMFLEQASCPLFPGRIFATVKLSKSPTPKSQRGIHSSGCARSFAETGPEFRTFDLRQLPEGRQVQPAELFRGEDHVRRACSVNSPSSRSAKTVAETNQWTHAHNPMARAKMTRAVRPGFTRRSLNAFFN